MAAWGCMLLAVDLSACEIQLAINANCLRLLILITVRLSWNNCWAGRVTTNAQVSKTLPMKLKRARLFYGKQFTQTERIKVASASYWCALELIKKALLS